MSGIGGLNHPDNHDGVLTHLEPDILECEVKRTLGNFTRNKASGGYGIPGDLLKKKKNSNLIVKILQARLQQYIN